MLREKKSTTKCDILHDSIYRIFLKRHYFRNGKQISECQELGTGVGKGGRLVWLSKGSMGNPCSGGPVQYLDCDGYRNLHV